MITGRKINLKSVTYNILNVIKENFYSYNRHRMKALSQYRKIHQLNRKDYAESCKDGALLDICSTGASTLGRRL